MISKLIDHSTPPYHGLPISEPATVAQPRLLLGLDLRGWRPRHLVETWRRGRCFGSSLLKHAKRTYSYLSRIGFTTLATTSLEGEGAAIPARISISKSCYAFAISMLQQRIDDKKTSCSTILKRYDLFFRWKQKMIFTYRETCVTPHIFNERCLAFLRD